MKKFNLNIITLLAIALVTLFNTIDTDAQISYTEKDTINGIFVEYRWQRSNIFISDSRTILNLRITNTNDYPVKTNFIVGFYLGRVIAYESKEMNICFEPEQRKRGGPAGLRFKYDDITREEIESDRFDWEFKRFEVEKIDQCNS